MRGVNLGSIRTRVERLAQDCGPNQDAPLLIHWRNPYDNCPECDYNLDDHAQREAVAAAADPSGLAPRLVFYYWPQTLTACPNCRAVLIVGSET